MEINEKELDEILENIFLYLSRKQPKSLQEYAVKYFIKISNYNKPFVYVKLINYATNCEYEKNIQSIFKFLEN